MNISLPEALKAFVERQVASGRCESPSAYVEQLIREDEKRQAEALLSQRVDAGEPLPVDAHFEEHLEVLLRAAEDSGEPVEVTQTEWERIEREALELFQQRRST